MALFLSGYALQQRTLQDLRVAIRPGHTRPSPKAHLPDYFTRETRQSDDGVIEIHASQADRDEKERLAKKYELREDPKTKKKSGGDRQAARAEKHDTQLGDAKTQATEEQLAMLEMIKKQAAQQAWAVDHPDPAAKNRLPITRAERRKLIKDEIQRLAQTDKPVYYQRRLW
jgi:hypothetical protein